MNLMETSEERILFLLKARGAQTAIMLAQSLQMTPVGARQHLASLQQQSLVCAEDRRGSVGRPKRYWALTEQAQQRFPDTHAYLTVELLNAISTVFGEVGLERLIAQREADSLANYQTQLANCTTLVQRVQMLAQLRAQEGYMAEWRAEDNGRYLLIENHCPICVAARQCQRFCRSELAIFQAVLGKHVSVERIDHLLAGARRCAYRIKKQ